MLIPRVFDDPRSCQMDGRVISTHKGSWSSHHSCKKASGQGVRTHPPMVLLAMVRERYKSVGLLLGLKRLPGDLPSSCEGIYIYTASGVLFLLIHSQQRQWQWHHLIRGSIPGNGAIWFVPNWCLSWFMSSWCSLIEGVINKIYNLLHHILG